MFNSGSGSGYTKKFAYSGVDEKGRSMVRMKLSQAGGDNYKVKVALEINEQDAGIEDETGEFAVWKLVHLEVDKADGVDPKGKLNKLNNSYRESFVHFEIQPTTTGGQPQGLTNGNRYIDGASGATNYRLANFDALNKKGWYYLASAKYYNEYNWAHQDLAISSFTPSSSKVEMIANNKIRFINSAPHESGWNLISDKKIRVFQNTNRSGFSIDLSVSNPILVQIPDPNDPNKQIDTWELTLSSANYSFVVDNASIKSPFDLADHGFLIGQNLTITL